MRKNLLAFAVVATLLSFAATMHAHHGISAWFDMTKSITVKGTVGSFDWTNPHSYIYADVKNEKGVLEKWTAEMGSPVMLARKGWRKDTLKAGDEITLIGRPAKDGKTSMLLNKAVLANGQELSGSDLLEGTPVGPPREF
jgi:Family of unknown function (DUF6152)